MTSIAQLDDDKALQQLILEFSHRDRTVKNLAIRRSIHFKEKAPRRELIRALTSGHTDIQVAAAEAIEALKPWITDEQWLEALQVDIWSVHHAAISVLAAFGINAPLKPLLRASTVRNRHVRAQAQTALKKAMRLVLNRSSIYIPAELLMPLLDSPENIARTVAVKLLGNRLPLPRLLAATHDHKWTVRQAALEVLGTMGTQVPLDLFLEALCDRNLSIRLTALLALSKQGERTPIPTIIAALHGKWRMEWAAWQALEELGARVPRELLLQTLNDPIAHVRVSAIQLLLAIDYQEPFPFEIIRNMLQDSDAIVRVAAIEALDQLGAIEPLEPFIAALNDAAGNVRQAAICVLEKLEIIESSAPFIAALSSDYYDTRQAALDALAKVKELSPQEIELIKSSLGDIHTYPNAIKCLKKKHMEVLREVAREASDILMYKGSGQILGSLHQATIAEAIGNMINPGPLLVNKLAELLDWPYGRVHIITEQALRKLGITAPLI